MMQQVNFYTAEFRPRIDLLSLNFCAAYLGVLTFVCSIYTGVQWWELAVVESEKRGLVDQKESIQAEISALEAQIESRAKDPLLEAKALELERYQKDRLTLRQFLQQEVPGNTEGFSGYFEDLARFHINGLRITAIDLSQGGEHIRLQGEVVSGDFVTRYVEGLKRSDLFKGRQFRKIEVNRVKGSEPIDNVLPDGQSLIFEVSTGSAGA